MSVQTTGRSMRVTMPGVLVVGGMGAAALLACGSVVQAQDVKVGYVDLAKLFDGYKRTRASDASLEQRGKAKEAEFETRVKELKKLRQGIELLNQESRDAKLRTIEEKEDSLQRFRKQTVRDLRRERDNVARQILGDIQQAVEAYASENGFTLILDTRSLLYGKSAHDVTDAVLKILNERYAARR